MIKRVTFKDEGQDFLQWDIEYPDDESIIGEVADCRPFQEWMWVGTKVYQRDIQVGDHLPIVGRISEGIPRPLTLKHPVEAVEEIEAPQSG